MKADMTKLRKTGVSVERKLDKKQVRKIKELIYEGYSCNSIAKAFGVSSQTVYKIRDNVIWKKVSWPNAGKLNLKPRLTSED